MKRILLWIIFLPLFLLASFSARAVTLNPQLGAPPVVTQTAPALSSILPSWTRYTLLTLAISEQATCRISNQNGLSFNQMTTSMTRVGLTQTYWVQGMLPGKTYTYYGICQDASLNETNFIASVAVAADQIPPQILNLTTSLINQTKALLNWQSSKPANSTVTCTGGGNTTTQSEPSLSIPHMVLLNNLQAGTGYTCNVQSTDQSGNTGVQNNFTFTTLPAAAAQEYYVAVNGSDNNPGTQALPFASITKARDTIRALPSKAGGVTVWIRGGQYFQPTSIDMTAQDSGTPGNPITYSNYPGEQVFITGGRNITGFTPVTDPTILSRLTAPARGQVYQTDLTAQGMTDFGALANRGALVAGTATVLGSAPDGMELYFNNQPMTLSRWPNQGSWDYITNGTANGFAYSDTRPSTWQPATDMFVYGAFGYNWASCHLRVLPPIDTVNEVVTAPGSNYGYKTGQWFYFENILEEIDAPGEWYVDRNKGILYFWPPSDPSQAQMVGSLANILMTLTNTTDLRLVGLTFEFARDTALTLQNTQRVTVEGCTIQNIGRNGIMGVGSQTDTGVLSSQVVNIGSGEAIDLLGGNYTALTGGRNFVIDTQIAHIGFNGSLSFALAIKGVNAYIAHNVMQDTPYSGMYILGNNHIIEFNEVFNAMTQSEDGGGIYVGNRPWAYRGSMIRYNFVHDINGIFNGGAQGIYLDDTSPGITVYGNVLDKIRNLSSSQISGIALNIGGGRDNIIENNMVIDSSYGLREGMWFTDPTAQQATLTALSQVPINSPPFSLFYPELPEILLENNPFVPIGSEIKNNIFYNANPSYNETGFAGMSTYMYFNNSPINQNESDPGFVDYANGNFNLNPNSPVFNLGFGPIPFDQIGLLNKNNTMASSSGIGGGGGLITTSLAAQSPVLMGDVNGDGQVTIYDAALVAKAALGLITFSPAQAKNAVVSGDANPSIYDAELILKKCLGMKSY